MGPGASMKSFGVDTTVRVLKSFVSSLLSAFVCRFVTRSFGSTSVFKLSHNMWHAGFLSPKRPRLHFEGRSIRDCGGPSAQLWDTMNQLPGRLV